MYLIFLFQQILLQTLRLAELDLSLFRVPNHKKVKIGRVDLST